MNSLPLSAFPGHCVVVFPNIFILSMKVGVYNKGLKLFI